MSPKKDHQLNSLSREALVAEVDSLRARLANYDDERRKRKDIESILSERQQRFQRLVQFLTDYIYTVSVIDGAAVETDHGPGCFSVTGYSSRDFAEDPELWFRMVHLDDQAAVTSQAQNALDGIDVKPLEHRIIHRDGSIRWIKNTIVLRRDKQDLVISYDGLINDITDLKRAEQDVERNRRQLIQADKMASLGVLISGIAHEMSNPNNFILLNAQLLQNYWRDIQAILSEYHDQQGDFYMAGIPFSEADRSINDLLLGIVNGSERIKKIVASLKTFSRQDRGKLDQQVDVREVVESAMLIIDNLIRRSTNVFQLDFDDSVPMVTGNFQQLEQVLINLFTNACHSLHHMDSAIRVSTSFDKVQRQVLITVSDEGEGIPQANMTRILDPFFTTKRDMDGTGLGLSISYELIRNHGGELLFESQVDVGTTVTVKLPAVVEQPFTLSDGAL